jgi:hypothetical protein
MQISMQILNAPRAHRSAATSDTGVCANSNICQSIRPSGPDSEILVLLTHIVKCKGNWIESL